jgi:hypothetical protein
MTRHRIRWTTLGLAGLLVTATVGCTRSIDVMPSSIATQEPLSRSIPNHERVPFIMDGFYLAQNGAPQSPSPDLERRFLHTVQDTHLFSTLVPLGTDATTFGNKFVTARVTVDETIDPHSGAAAWKGFVIGASMFLLSPVIELDYDYAAQASLEVERWDGQVKRYEARSSGTVRYHLFGATPIMIQELKGQVTETCLNDLMAQLVRDTTHYMASTAPLPDVTIRTVTVRARKPAPTSAGHSFIPVSTTPTP